MGKLYTSFYVLIKGLIGENGSYVASLLVDILFYFIVFAISILLSTILGYIKLLVTAEIYHIKNDEEKHVLAESIFKGIFTFFIIIFMYLVFISTSSIYSVFEYAVESGNSTYAGFISITTLTILCYLLILLEKHYFTPINNFIYFQLIARWGIGPFTSDAIKSYVRKECGLCKNTLRSKSLSNSIEATSNGFIFKCSKCRNVNAKEPESNFIDSYGTFKTSNVNPYGVIRNLFKETKKDIKQQKNLENPIWLSYSGVLGFFRSGDDFRLRYSQEFKNIPKTCPECSCDILIKDMNGKSDIEVAQYSSCKSCGILVNDMWQFKSNVTDDARNIKQFLNHD